MPARHAILITIFSLCLVLGLPQRGYGQFFYGHTQSFGKNVVVYDPHGWAYYRFPAFDVYYYSESDKYARWVSYKGTELLYEFEENFGITFDKKITFVCFATLSHLKQSNLNSDQQEDLNTSSRLRLANNKILLAATGNRNDITQEIRRALASEFLELMGISTENKTKPEWIAAGATEYFSGRYTPEQNAYVIDRILNPDTDELELDELAGQEAEWMGLAFWRFIAEVYGEEMVYRVIRRYSTEGSIGSAIWKEINIDMKYIITDFQGYYAKMGKAVRQSTVSPRISADTYMEERIYQVSLSNDLSKAAFTVNELGEYRIYLLDLRTKEKECVFKGGYKVPQNEDLSYPKIDWHISGSLLAFVVEEEIYPYLYIYNLRDESLTKREFFKIQKISDISFSSSGNKLVMSATSDGYSDIYTYDFTTQILKQITDDSFDDVEPTFFRGENYIVFKSNRYSDTLTASKTPYLGSENYNLFVYNHKTNSKALLRMPGQGVNELSNPSELTRDLGVFYTRRNNALSLRTFEADSTITFIDTTVHYRYFVNLYEMMDTVSHIDHSYDANQDVWMDIRFKDEDYVVSWGNDFQKKWVNRTRPVYIDSIDRKPTPLVSALTPADVEIDLDNYTFEPEVIELYEASQNYVSPEVFLQRNRQTNAKDTNQIYNQKKLDEYRQFYELSFFYSDLTTDLQNSGQIQSYETFTGGQVQGGALSGGVGLGLVELSLENIFEDYKISAQFNVPSSLPVLGFSLFPDNDLALIFEHKYDRLNKRLLLYRSSRLRFPAQNNPFINTNDVSLLANIDLTYPFNPVLSLQLSLAYRHDRTTLLSRELFSLAEPDATQDYVITRLSLIFDNVLPVDKNLKRGTQWKFFVEWMQEITENDNSFLINLGLDYRYFYRIHRNLIWANRVAIGTSVAPQKLIHYIGGTDNEFQPNFDNSIPVDLSQNYRYQTLMTNMRGFNQNIRNGNTAVVANTEIRFPIVQYFYKKPLSYGFLRTLQVVPFFDMGTAWNGLNPFSEENNPLFQYTVEEGPVKVTIRREINPIVFGYGIGARMELLGYFVRLDVGWGFDTQEVRGPAYHVTLTEDF